MNHSVDSAALLRFISGDSPADECLAIERWMAADRAHRAEVELLGRAWELAIRSGDPTWDTTALWRQIRPTLGAPSGQDTATDVTPQQRATRRSLVLIPSSDRRWWRSVPARVAAAAILVAGTALTVREATPPRDAGSAPVMRTYMTKRGERAELRLTDGSRVVLGGASTLRIPESFGESVRELYLDGEAYFDVSDGSALALRVHTPRAVAEDVGTRFIIMAYSSDTVECIAVADGIVAVHGSDATDSVVLRARDVGLVSATGTVSAVRNVDIDRYFSWLDGVIRFDEDPLADAVKVVERHYGIEIRISDSALARRRFTGSIRATSVHEDLRGLALLLDARYERKGNAVILTPFRQSPPRRGR